MVNYSEIVFDSMYMNYVVMSVTSDEESGR